MKNRGLDFNLLIPSSPYSDLILRFNCGLEGIPDRKSFQDFIGNLHVLWEMMHCIIIMKC